MGDGFGAPDSGRLRADIRPATRFGAGPDHPKWISVRVIAERLRRPDDDLLR